MKKGSFTTVNKILFEEVYKNLPGAKFHIFCGPMYEIIADLSELKEIVGFNNIFRM